MYLLLTTQLSVSHYIIISLCPQHLICIFVPNLFMLGEKYVLSNNRIAERKGNIAKDQHIFLAEVHFSYIMFNLQKKLLLPNI